MGFNPDEPRAPRGTGTGGQWVQSNSPRPTVPTQKAMSARAGADECGRERLYEAAAHPATNTGYPSESNAKVENSA